MDTAFLFEPVRKMARINSPFPAHTISCSRSSLRGWFGKSEDSPGIIGRGNEGGTNMPGLVCSAQSCVYNDAMYCSRGNIEVGGADAQVCQDTCCESFQGRSGDSAKNTMKSGCTCTQSDIHCEAKNCMHNQNCVCHAEKVDIAGAAACRCDETECVTFEEK